MQIGITNNLTINRSSDFGLYLIDDNEIEALLPNRYVKPEMKIGDKIDVFIYNDSEDRRTATTEKPLVYLNQFAFLEVIEINNIGAFVNWGLPKDLLIPHTEQTKRLNNGDWILVKLLLDEKTDRLYATAKTNKHFSNEVTEIKVWDTVKILPFAESDLGVSVVVNQKYKGLIFSNDIYKEIEPGAEINGFVKKIREDGKIDISLSPLGYKNSIDKNCAVVLKAIKREKGFLKLTDNSSPEEISTKLGLSKKAFKKAIGNLYKQKIIDLDVKGIKLLKS